jgi:hypothetical protein
VGAVVPEPRADRPRRRTGLALLAVLLAGLGTACAGIPTSGPIGSAPPIEDEGSDLRGDVQGPRPGAQPIDIVTGFLDAMSFELAKADDFLTPEARDGWQHPTIEVYDRSSTETTQESIVRLFYDRVARIENHQYVGVLDSEPQQYALRLEQNEEGQWRIDDLPNVLLISSLDLSNNYAAFTTYYPDPAGQVLVPDRIWLPADEQQIPPLLAQALVDGPTGLLGPRGVANPFPEGTRVVSAVVSGPVAAVALSGAAIAETDSAARGLMLAQLTATMRQLRPVEQVTLTIGEQVVDSPDRDIQLDSLAAFGTPPAYLLTDASAVLADEAGSDFTAVPGPLGRGELPARSLAVSLDRTEAAVVDVTGALVYRAPLTEDALPELVYEGEDIAPPSYDRYGNLWLVDHIGTGRDVAVKLVQPDGQVSNVLAPDLAGESVTDLRIAPDGVRVAVVSDRVGAPLRLGHLVLGDQPEIDLTVAIPFEDPLVSDVAWASLTDLLVVVSAPDGLSRPVSVNVDGSTVAPGSQTGITEIAAYEGRQSFVLTDVGNVLRQTSVLEWEQVTVAKAKAVVYPG